jgi:preprotein translocase subunit SecY
MFGYTNVLSPGISIYLYLFLSLVGTSLCIFIAEKITEKGICDGRDLLMAVSVIVYLPKTIAEQFLERLDKNHLPLFVLDLLLIFLSLGIAIFIHQTFIRVPIKAAIEEDPENTSEANKHILIKLNAVADFPINFSIAIQILALRVVYFYNDASNSWFYSDLVQSLFLFGVTFLFTFLYTTRYITPETIKKEFLALTTSFRIEEGKQPYSERNVVVKEASYEKLLLRATFINACFLGFLAILPIILPKLGFSKELAGLVGAASIIFIVNAVSGALYNIDQYLYKYDFETIEDIAGSDFVGKEVFYLPEDSE